MTSDQIIEEILLREGENLWPDANGVPTYRAPGDMGGRTTWGISERAHPEAWTDGPPSQDNAREIYRREYVAPWEWVSFPPLRNQLVDCTVLHGLNRTVRLLQLVLGISVDGRLGPQTRYWTERGGRDTRQACLVNNSLVAYRLKFIDALTDWRPSQKINEEGWEKRALRFLV